MSKKIVITGGIGSGKSSVAKMLAQRGYCVWDADVFSREVLFQAEIQSRIKTIFGDTVFIKDGILNREYIRNQIFSNSELKKSFEGIMHPAMFEHFHSKYNIMLKIAPTSWVFYEASLILELKRKSEFDFCIVVYADENIKIERLSSKRNLSREDCIKVIQSQMPDNEKIKYADYLINNSGSEEELKVSVNKLILHLNEKFSSS